jgi:hypothetical protein
MVLGPIDLQDDKARARHSIRPGAARLTNRNIFFRMGVNKRYDIAEIVVGLVKYNRKKPYIHRNKSNLNKKSDRYFLCPQVFKQQFTT